MILNFFRRLFGKGNGTKLVIEKKRKRSVSKPIGDGMSKKEVFEKIIPEVADMIVRGHSFSTMADKLNGMGYLTRTGRAWSGSSLHHEWSKMKKRFLEKK